LGDVAAPLSEHDCQLRLPVELLRMGRREEHRGIRADHGRRVLREERRELRYLLGRELRAGLTARLLSLFEVLAVIPADAKHVTWWPRDRRMQLRGRQRNAASRLARRVAEVRQEFLAGKQKVEHVVFVGGAAHDAAGR